MSNGNQVNDQNEASDFRRFIEESFPVKEVGEASVREKNVRQGHVSTLHLWWARRPLAASRATMYATLTPVPKDAEEWQKKRDFIIQLSQWENSSNQSLLERARREILEANGGVPPKVLDPFAGGGSYPLEALRLGCESYANDYNPVAVLIEKAMLEYPQKFGRPFDGMPDWAKPQVSATKTKDEGGKNKSKNNIGEQPALFDPATGSDPTEFNPLLNAVRYWGEWVQKEAQKELEDFYPSDTDGSTPAGFIWARTIPCQNPACGQSIPLMRGFWLSKKAKKKIALYPEVNKGKVRFSIVGDGYDKWPNDFDPEKGTVARAKSTCLVCGSVTDDKTTRKLFQDGKASQKLIVIVLNRKGSDKRYYRIANSKDEETYLLSEKKLLKEFDGVNPEWGLDSIPNESLRRVPIAFGVINVWIYGVDNWGQLFNARQTLTILTLITKIRLAHQKMQSDCSDEKFIQAVTTYLGLAISRNTSYNAKLCWWEPLGERSFNVFGRQALPMVFDYSEQNPFGPFTGNWNSQIRISLDIIDQLSKIQTQEDLLIPVGQNSATQLPFPDNYFDAILTDPPYYDNVPYSYLSDFFYVWLKRVLGHIYPELFPTPLTPKNSEIVAYAQKENDYESGHRYFEDKLKQAFSEVIRILKPHGTAVIVYAHKSTAGWETLINSLLDSGLVITAAWPLNTEMQSRMRAIDAATLASSIYIVARKESRQPTGFYNDVLQELRQYLDIKLHRLWEEGIGGADFFIAAIGSAIEVFGKYEQVMDYEGNLVRADRLLDEVRTIATDYAVRQILHDGFAGEITPLARLYVLWRWNYGDAKVPFDEARKLGQSCGLDISQEWSRSGFVSKEKEFVRLLGPQNRKLEALKEPRDLIDVLHKTLLLWEKGKRSDMVSVLAETGFGKSEAFYRVAQAISETLPNESKEKKLLDGFLAGRERVQDEVEQQGVQGRLFNDEG